MKKIISSLFVSLILTVSGAHGQLASDASDPMFDKLKNYRVDTPTMISAGLPTTQHFEAFKAKGVRNVIDLIPGDRSSEIALMKTLGLAYENIQVEWNNPTIENFEAYVVAMKQSAENGGVTLTHCRLNWRGAVFTYLYRVTQLGESEEVAKQHMEETWKANATWQSFIEQVKAQYARTQ